MLPSGNDAACVLAEYFGQYLYEIKWTKANQATDEKRRVIDPTKYFINEMNKYARALKLENTVYANPHGLGNNNNKSTAYD